MSVIKIKQDNKIAIRHMALQYFLAFADWFMSLEKRLNKAR